MLRNKLEICASLAWETLRRPRWAYHHFWGYVDERLLLRFHRANDGNMGANLKTINEALSVAAAEDAGFLAALNEQFAMVCGKQESPADTSSPIRAQNDASLELQRLVYCLTSLRRPDNVVEIGVGRGATTRAILLALQRNQKGHLYSIDFPALRRRYAQQIGDLVPEELRKRWSLILGPSQHELRKLLKKIGAVDLFVHDGAHSYHIQRADYECAVERLGPGGYLISDDVNNESFEEVAASNRLHRFFVRQSKKDPIGVAIRTPA